jgi:hypothetical protein
VYKKSAVSPLLKQEGQSTLTTSSYLTVVYYTKESGDCQNILRLLGQWHGYIRIGNIFIKRVVNLQLQLTHR